MGNGHEFLDSKTEARLSVVSKLDGKGCQDISISLFNIWISLKRAGKGNNHTAQVLPN